MTQSTSVPDTMRTGRSGRRVGYVIAIAVNAVVLFIVNNLLDWDVLPWLTDDFEELLPLINFSILLTIIVNAIYLAYDAPWFKSLTQIVTSVIGLAVAIRTWQVFPFDFSGYDFNWEAVARVVLIIAMVGLCAGIIAEVVKLIARAGRVSST